MTIRHFKALVYMASLVLCTSVYASSCNNKPCNKNAKTSHWSDSSHTYIANKADKLAYWIDGFFGEARSDNESPNSVVRLRLNHSWDEDYSSQFKARLRGKLKLPELNERLSLLFSDDNSEQTISEELDPNTTNVNDDTDVSLQFNRLKQDKTRLDYRLGLRSSGQLKLGLRYRYEYPYKGTKIRRFIQRVEFKDGEGFISKSRFEQDSTLSSTRLLRYSISANYGENTHGVEWLSQVIFSKKLNGESAVAYYLQARGITRPEVLTQNYGFGFTYRRNILKEWLFFELQPEYGWRRYNISDTRHTAARLSSRIEIIFD